MAAYCRFDVLVTYGLTSCRPGSALGPTLGNEYGKTSPFITHMTNTPRRCVEMCMNSRHVALAMRSTVHGQWSKSETEFCRSRMLQNSLLYFSVVWSAIDVDSMLSHVFFC